MNNTNVTPRVDLQGQLIMMGAKGDSAYEIAVQEGFEGTVDEWLLSLTGPTGPTGPIGPIGPTGPTGSTGDAATIQVGTVTTLDPDENATVSNSGTETNAVFNFGIPRGKEPNIFFNNVSDMKQGNLKVGMVVKTLGYYEINDGGSGTYYIRTKTDDDIDDGGSIHILNNDLVAELILGDIMNVKQFGAKGDGITDDTIAFENCNSYSKNILIPYGTYLIDNIHFGNNKIIYGQGSTLNCTLKNNVTVGIMSNCILKNLTINSLADKPWSRSVTGDNCIIENCTFSGFRDSTTQDGHDWKNDWGIHFTNNKNIKMINCKFENNDFQDLMIYENCENLYFENCSGSHNGEEGFVVDIEPSNGTGINKNIVFTNCNINIAHVCENIDSQTQNKNVTFNNCIIETLRYDGSNCDINNCIIKNYKESVLTTNSYYYLGGLKINNSAGFGKNLIDDPYFDTISSHTYNQQGNNFFWTTEYAEQISIENMFDSVIDEKDGKLIRMNPNKLNGIWLCRSKNIPVKSGESYYVEFTGKAKYPSSNEGETNYSLFGRISWYNDNDTMIDDDKKLSMFRKNNISSSESSIETQLSTYGGVFIAPEGATYCKISLFAGRKIITYLQSCGLYPIYNGYYGRSNMPTLVSDDRRVWYNDTLPSLSKGSQIKYNVGDIMYYKTPTTHIGAVCTVSGIPGTWCNFGSIDQLS